MANSSLSFVSGIIKKKTLQHHITEYRQPLRLDQRQNNNPIANDKIQPMHHNRSARRDCFSNQMKRRTEHTLHKADVASLLDIKCNPNRKLIPGGR